ncbi:1-phosphatidylinositol 3-phosphate 5-kinase [Caerostris extrusa]|uniref:1-phosphatidylinositol 3-phosphate 5-kinase n=1 Tax=Caerostris extrusa TaxID=172846 RepID=A0AAV4R236_CAEEX|nr:1-phosphatidylinositol 3-phosphate 5-kinase [Caerostris extrusa]
MAKKLESQTSLTEFAPLSPESKSQTFSIRNLFFRNKDKSTTSEAKSLEPQDEKTNSSTSHHLYISDDSVGKRMTLASPERRGMYGILGKIMDNIVDKKKKGLQNYRDSDFKQYWMPDSNCKECYDCGDKFTTFRRRHHCRVCGQIFCWKCCSQEISGDLIGYTDDLRVCSYCCKMVLSCVQSLDSAPQLDDDSQSFRESQQKKFRFDSQSDSSPSPKPNITSPARRKSSVIGFREEDFAKAKPFKTALDTLSCRERSEN